MLKYLILLLFCCPFFACQQSNTTTTTQPPKSIPPITKKLPNTVFTFPYSLTEPNEVWVLDRQLTEISGLTYQAHTDRLLAVNDEQGIIFELDRKDKGAIIQQHSFAKRGDYEGIAQMEETTVVLKSNGTLHFYDAVTGTSDFIKTPLSAKNDVEGLVYEPKQKLLLLACKGQSLEKSESKKTKKVIYAYSLQEKQLVKTPFLTIKEKELLAFIQPQQANYTKSQFKALKKRVRSFAPSGMAIHPKDGLFYILSAKGSLLLTITPDKIVEGIYFLDENTCAQPEGICFDADNNLYISTEGKGFYGKIFKFVVSE